VTDIFSIPDQLRAAVARQDLAAITVLLQSTDDLHPGDVWLALMDAADLAWDEGVNALLATGVPLTYLLECAIYFLHRPAVELLLKAGADLEVRDQDDLTPLHQAIYTEVDCEQWSPGEITALLLEHGADVSAETTGGTTAADLAKRHGHPLAEELSHLMANRSRRPWDDLSS
jgi:hypothetical protein